MSHYSASLLSLLLPFLKSRISSEINVQIHKHAATGCSNHVHNDFCAFANKLLETKHVATCKAAA
jgi:hypothetical protein